jgi:hypothetical protein
LRKSCRHGTANWIVISAGCEVAECAGCSKEAMNKRIIISEELPAQWITLEMLQAQLIASEELEAQFID